MLIRDGGSHTGSLLLGAGGILFVAYVFNVGGTETFFDSFFRNLDSMARRQDGAVQAGALTALPWVGGALAFFLLWIFFSAGKKQANGMRKERKLRKRGALTMQDFADLVNGLGVGPRVARESYRLLLPHYRNRMRAVLTDSLAEDLQMTPVMVRDLYGNMLRMTDRQKHVGEDDLPFNTILEMMQSVEQCEDRSLTESRYYRRQAKVDGVDLPAPVSRIRPPRNRSHSFIRPVRFIPGPTDAAAAPDATEGQGTLKQSL